MLRLRDDSHAAAVQQAEGQKCQILIRQLLRRRLQPLVHLRDARGSREPRAAHDLGGLVPGLCEILADESLHRRAAEERRNRLSRDTDVLGDLLRRHTGSGKLRDAVMPDAETADIARYTRTERAEGGEVPTGRFPYSRHQRVDRM